jgi:uncharacterized repeat protein (TIGR04138 family)
MSETFYAIVDEIYESDSRYKEDAYAFVMESLSYAQKKFKCQRHVKTEELLEGMRELLLKKFGPMTMTVLKHWGINTTEDFGHIVFKLVKNKVLSKTKDDCVEQFKNGYDFDEAFTQCYRKQLHKKISRMRSF